MTIDKDFLSNFTHTDDQDQDEYKRNDTIQIGFEQELKSLTVHHGDSARFEAKIRLISILTCEPIDPTLLKIEWRLNDISIGINNNSKYQFGCLPEENRYWMEIQQCQQQDERVYTIYISYDNERLHDESSAYLFVDNCPAENDEQSLQTIQTDIITTNPSRKPASITSLNRFIPPTITRLLQSSYRYHSGEQLHFLVEYISPTSECQSTWQVQYSHEQIAKPIEDGLIVNADCSSILIIESINSQLQGLYTFYVENLYGRAMTQTIVIVHSNDNEDETPHYNEIQDDLSNKHQEIAIYHSNGVNKKHISATPDFSSGESSEYEEVKIHSCNGKSSSSMSTTDEEMPFPTIKEEESLHEQKQQLSFDLSLSKDLYGQRHIAYFDPSPKLEHVEPIEQFENDDSFIRLTMNDHRIKNGHDKIVHRQFQLPLPPPIDQNFEEHIYEDIPQIIHIPETSATTSIHQQSIQISDNTRNGTEHSPHFSSSPNSLDEALNNVEQWSDIIVDNDILELRSPSRFSQASNHFSTTNDYVDEQYLNYSFHLNSSQSQHRSLPELSIRNTIVNNNHVDHLDSNNFERQVKLHDQSVATEHIEKIEHVLPADLSHTLDQVVEIIHEEDELLQATETVISCMQASNHESSLLNDTLTPMSSLNLSETIASDINEHKPLDVTIPHLEESVEILSNTIVDLINSSSENTSSINYTLESISNNIEMTPFTHFSVSNVSTNSIDGVVTADATTDDQMPIITLTIIGDKIPEHSHESLTVPTETNLLPLATVPDQAKDTDDIHVREKLVQDIISASLEPTTVIHIEGTVEIIPSTSTIQTNDTSSLDDHEQFFDVESDLSNKVIKTDVTSITVVEKPAITLAAAEKLQHDAANELTQNDFYDVEVNLAPTNVPSTANIETDSVPFVSPSNIKKNDNVHVPIEKSVGKREEASVSTQQDIPIKKKSKSVTKKKTDVSPTSTGKEKLVQTIANGHQNTLTDQNSSVEREFSDMQKISTKKKEESAIFEKTILVDSKAVTSLSTELLTTKTDNEELLSSIVQIEQKPIQPKFTLRLKPSITLNHDDKLHLEVHYIGQPEPNITWYYKSNILLSSSNIHIVQSHENQTLYSALTILKITSEYDGKFKVIIKNELGEAVSTTQVNVKRASLAVQLHAPTKKITVNKTSKQLTNDQQRVSFSGASGGTTTEGETMSNETPNLTARRRSSTLAVPEGKPTFPHPLESELYINEDEQLTLECVITGNPLPELIWLFNDRKIVIGDGYDRKTETLNPHTDRHQLIIAGRHKKLGIYKAQAQNTYGHTISTCHVKKSAHSIDQRRAAFEESELSVPNPPTQRRRSSVTAPNLEQTQTQVIQKPVIIQGLSKLQVDLGSPCALTCKSKYDTAQQWIKDGQPITSTKSPDGNVFTKADRSNDDNMHVLNIKQFKQENSGNYELILKNNLGEIKSQGQLEMKGVPPSFTVEPKTTQAVKGKMAEFICRADGSPKPNVQWFLNGQILHSGGKFSIVEERGLTILRINNITDTDSGTVKCILKNALSEISREVQLQIIGEQRAPKILDKSKAIEINAGESTQLFVKVSGAPTPTIQWTRKGMILSSNDLYELKNDNDMYYLSIKKAGAEVLGTYVVTATNSAGKVSADIDLSITGLTTLFERSLRDTSVTQGRPLTLDCEVNTKNGVPTIIWMKNNQPIVKSDRIVPSVKGNKVHVLTIQKATPADAGYYSVKATLGNDTSVSDAQVTIEVAPTFTKLPETVGVVDGQDCEINVEVAGLPPPNVKWSRLAEDLVTNAKYHITSDGTHYQLRIYRATAQDAGEYQIICSNNLGRITGKIDVRISSPPIILQPLKDLFIPIKRTARLETQIYAYPEPKIVWSKDAIPIDFSLYPGRINAEERRGTYSLVIKNIQLDDGGFYVCSAQNLLGTSKTSATLVIEVAPVFLQKLEKLEGVENCDIDIRLQVAGYPKPKLDFSFNQKPIDLKGRYSLKELKSGRYIFTIANAQTSDAGSYSCTATNSLGQASSVGKLTLFPLAPPNFTKNLTDSLFPVGGILKVDLKVSGLPFPRLTWLKDGQVFDENDRISIVYDVPSAIWSLIIHDCQESDSGVYECRAKNPGGEKISQCKITVSGEAASFADTPEKVSCLEGQTAVFGCRVAGDPYPLVVWSKGKTKTFTENTSKYALYYDDELDAHFFEINQCSNTDTGIYTVTIQNAHKTITKPVSCFIVTKPEEVIDYKSILRKMEASERELEAGPDWGKLRKAKGKPKGPGDPGWQYQLKHFELTGDAQLKTYDKGQSGDLLGLSPTDSAGRRARSGTGAGNDLDGDDGRGLGVPKPGAGKDRRISRLGLVTFTKPLSNITVHEGKNAAFECNVSEAEASVTWYINDQPVPSQRAQTLAIGKTRRLVLKECVLSENDSKITCALDEATKTNAQLFVKEEPFDFTDKLKNLKIKRGDKCELQCAVNKPNIALQWFKDGKPITDIKEEVDGLIHRLIIPKTEDKDKGLYTAKYQDAQTEGLVEILGPPQIVKPPTDSVLLVGQSVVLTAEIIGNPKPQVSWLFKGQPIKPTATKHQIDAKKEGIYTLTILKGETADDGQYTVVAENPVDKVHATAKVSVCTKPKVDKLADVSVNIGDTARIQCQYSGNPTPTITWYKDGKPIPANDQRFVITQETATLSVLTISNTDMDDKGVYSVKLTNIAGDVEGKANLTIKPIKPSITRDLDTVYTGIKGEDLIISIAGTGNPNPTCQWFKNNTEITSTTDQRFQFKEDKATKEYFLIITNATQDDMGEYQAQLTNVAGLIKSKKSKITIQKQPTFIKKPQSITVNQNETAKIECQIDALPQAKVTWLVAGKPVTPKEGYETTFDTKTGTATLVVKSTTTKHAGPITVRAENTAGSAEETADINVRSAPILLKPLTDTEVIINNSATFTCEFQASPQATVKWFCNGKPLTPSTDKYDISYDTKTNQHKLIVKNTTLNDNGTYSAQASNELGQIQTEAKLHVIHGPNFVSGLQDKTVIEKETIELIIKVTGTPQPTLTWLKAGKEIKADEKKYSIVPIDKDGNAKLIIKDIQEEDQGLYSCVAKNKVGTNQTDGHLKVTAPLKFIQPLQDTDVLTTQSAILTCEVQGIPKANVKWYFNDIELKSTQKQTISSKQNVHSLTVNRTDQTDAGVYKAIADNGSGKPIETTCTLVVGSKPKVEGKPTDVNVNVEQPAVLECTFSGFPKPEVTWYKDNVPLTTPDQRVTVHEDKPNVHTLKIARSQMDDKATYTCKAKNRFGEVEAKMNLTVNSIKPTIVRDLEEQKVVEKGKPLQLQVEITGLPQPQVKWFKGNDEINPATNKDYQITFDNKQTYTLTVQNCSPDHQAEYSVQATNPGGTVKSKKAKVIVQKKPEFIKLPQSQTVKEGQPVVFDAQIDAYPQPKVTWLKDGKPLTSDLGFESQYDVKTGQIILKHKGATPKQAGELICRVENSAGTTDAPVTLDVQTVPVITKKLTDQEVMIDNEIRFVVDITGSPTPKISWTKDDQPIKPDAQHLIESNGTTQTLIIKNAKATDEGKYRVSAENPLGHVESTAQVTVLEQPFVDQPFGDITQPVGSDVTLKCKVIGGRPKATVTWLKNGKEFKPDDRHKVTSLPDGTCELSIKSLDETDNQDKYTLLIKNKVGQKEITSTITVKAPLEFVHPLKDQDVIAQSPCTLTVETNGIPKPTVKWYFNDQELKNTPKTKIDSKQNTHTLTLPKAELTDEGVYKCIATNPDGTIETKAHVSVCTKPKVDGKVNDVTVQITEPAELRTKFSAIPKPIVTWYKASDMNTPLKPNENIEISELPDGTSVLKIKKTNLVDSSPYIARAINKVGEVDSKINLTVKEIKPQILSDLTNVNATRDQPAEFIIKATGNPQPTINWFKNDTEEILPTNKDFQIVHDVPSDTYILKINKCKPEHQGDYSAVITNSGGTIKSKKGKLTVTKSPEFLEKPKPVDVNENQPVEFHTKIDAYPAPKITWLFDGKPITPKDGFDVQTDQATGTSVLTIKQVTPKHDGKITVKAENPAGTIEETVQCSVKTAPKITKKPTDTEALLHTDAVFTVDVSGSPKPQIEWIHGGKPVKPSKKYEIVEESPTTSKLIIHDVTPEDEAPVDIKVKNPLGETDTTVQLKVLETPRIEPQLTDKEVTLNQPLILKANVHGRPKVDIQWLKDQKPLSPSDRVKIERNGDECILTIPNVKEEDIGAYTLSVKNKVGKVDSTANVNVTAALKFNNQLNDIDIIQGSNSVLTVECEGVPRPKLTWYFNDTEIKSNQKTRIDAKGPVSTLTINKADMPDIGVYKVVADNGKERIETQAKIDVCVKPKVEGKPADVSCLLTETAKLNVKFSAIPKPTITWHKADGTEVKPDARIQIINDENGQSTLIINDTTSQDSQPYIARATNKVGSVEAKVNLTVKEVKPSLKNDLEQQTINVGDELVYRLLVDGRPTPTVKFYKDGNEVGPVTIEQPTKPGDTTVTAVLRIPKATIDDQGEYQASIENSAGTVKTKKAKVIVQQVPVFLKAPEDASVSQGKDVTYEAQLSGFPVPKVTWLLNGKPLTPNTDCAITFDTPTQKASLTLRKVDATKHAGVITCQLENPAGKVTHDVKLDVRTQPKISKPLKDKSVVQGQDVTLSIESIGNPAPKPEWYLNDKPIATNDQRFQVIIPKEGNVYELKIKQTKPTDEGVYKVVMKNSEGEITSEAKLNVHVAPVIGSLPAKIEAVQGQQVIIPCKVSGHPKPEITFLKDKKDVMTLDDKSRFRIEHDEKTDEVRLIISDVKEDDQGKYTIRAKNPAQTVEEQTNLVVTAPLAFIDKLEDTNVISGQNLTLICRCQGIPKPTIKWFQNDTEIKSTTKQKIESKPDGTQTLTINRVDLTDGGQFKIAITNPQGTITSTCNVHVVMKPKIDTKPHDIQVLVGEPAELNVKLSGIPKPKIQWLKNGQPLTIDNKRVKTIEKDDSCALLIDNTQLDDKATYTCQVENTAGTAEVQLNLNVQQIKPSLKSDLVKDVTVQAGETIPLTIKAGGTKPKVKWFKNGEEVIETVEESYEIIEEEETYTLLIKNAKPKDSGEYQAVVTNDVGEVKSKKVKVQVQKAPELKKKPQALVTVKEGQPAQFDCEFDGNPTPKVSWLRDGKPLTPKDGFEIKTDTTTGKSVLTINQATPKHAGPITLRLENSVGTPIEEVVQLKVETAPQLLQKPQPTCEAHINQTATILFKCLATPEPTIKLYKNEIQIPLNGDHYELVPSPTDSTTYEIKIKNVRPEDEGNYRINIENPLGKIDSNVQVTTVDNVSIKPSSKPNKTDLKQHETLVLEYIVDGKPKPDIIFMKDGKEIKPSPKTQITYDDKTKVCRLVTTDVGQDDQGTYTLIAKNKLGEQKTEPVKVTVTAPLVVKTKLPDTIDGVLGESITLTVEAEGLPQPKVTWLFNGQPIKPSPKHKIEISKDNPNQTVLTIPKLDTTDTGKYTAVIDNGLEKVETSTTLTVHTKPKLESKLEPNLNYNVGDQAEIPIRLSGENNTVTWYKDSKQIQFDNRIRLVTDEYNSYKLVIDDLRSDDKGTYSIIIKNKGGNLEIKTVLNVKEQKPQLLADLNDSPAANTAKIGEKFFLEIRAQGKPRPQVVWLLNGQELSSNSPDYELVVTEDGTYRIIFHQFHERYLGEYQAVITSTSGTIRTRIIRVVGQQAPIFTQAPPKFIQIKTGEKLTIECMAKGHPPPTITWLRDGKVLSNKDGFNIQIDEKTGHSLFIIPQATIKHSGKYECKVENQYGTHTAEINIDVLPPPVTQQKLKDFDVSRGQEVTITVTANGSPLPSCIWFHNDKQLHAKPNRVIMIDDGPTHILKLLDVELTDAGMYKAVVENAMSITELISKVTVRDVSDESSVPVEVRVSEGGSCTLECQASGTPLPEVIWTRDGQQIKASEHFVLEASATGNHRLIIKNAQYTHAGKYVANVKNKIQTHFMNFNVTVTERKPGTSASATINLTGLTPEQQVQQIQTQIRPLFLHFGLQDIPSGFNDILFNMAQDKKFQTPQDQMKERERLLNVLANYLSVNSKHQLGHGKKLNWPEVVKIIFYNRFPQIAQTNPIVDSPDGYTVQMNDLIQYSK